MLFLCFPFLFVCACECCMFVLCCRFVRVCVVLFSPDVYVFCFFGVVCCCCCCFLLCVRGVVCFPVLCLCYGYVFFIARCWCFVCAVFCCVPVFVCVLYICVFFLFVFVRCFIVFPFLCVLLSCFVLRDLCVAVCFMRSCVFVFCCLCVFWGMRFASLIVFCVLLM